MGSTVGQVHADGSFIVDNVQPLSYTVGLGGLGSGYVKATLLALGIHWTAGSMWRPAQTP
jgi:hypothetical protein